MKYFYNYSFLNKWMEANSKITNKEIMKAMGTTSNTCLDSWIRMKSPLPTIAMLRFCNAFHVPLSAFIVDADKDSQEEGCCEAGYVCPGIDDQFEPDGGYIDNDEKRKQGTMALRNPLDVERMKSVVPGWTSVGNAGNGGAKGLRLGRKEEHKKETSAAPMDAAAPMNAAAPTPIAEQEQSKEPDISLKTLNRMLDIIAEQQKQIGDQQKLINELTRRLDSQQPSYNMVAEEIHRETE